MPANASASGAVRQLTTAGEVVARRGCCAQVLFERLLEGFRAVVGGVMIDQRPPKLLSATWISSSSSCVTSPRSRASCVASCRSSGER